MKKENRTASDNQSAVNKADSDNQRSATKENKAAPDNQRSVTTEFDAAGCLIEAPEI